MNTLFDDVIDRMVESGELLPDGAEHIRARGWDKAHTPGDALVKLFEFLEGPGEAQRAANPYLRSGAIPGPGGRCLSPAYRADETKSPLRRMLERFPLAEGAAEALEREWGFAIGNGTPGRMAREIARRLADRANHRHLADPPPRPASEQRVLDVLISRFCSEVPVSSREPLARSLGREFAGCFDEDRLVEMIAKRLTFANSAEHYGLAKPLPPDDPRVHAKIGAARAPTPEPTPSRDEQGRFAREPVYKGNPF